MSWYECDDWDEGPDIFAAGMLEIDVAMDTASDWWHSPVARERGSISMETATTIMAYAAEQFGDDSVRGVAALREIAGAGYAADVVQAGLAVGIMGDVLDSTSVGSREYCAFWSVVRWIGENIRL